MAYEIDEALQDDMDAIEAVIKHPMSLREINEEIERHRLVLAYALADVIEALIYWGKIHNVSPSVLLSRYAPGGEAIEKMPKGQWNATPIPGAMQSGVSPAFQKMRWEDRQTF